MSDKPRMWTITGYTYAQGETFGAELQLTFQQLVQMLRTISVPWDYVYARDDEYTYMFESDEMTLTTAESD